MVAPELTIEQKAYRTRITYRLFDDHVEYTIIDARGDKASFSAKYEDLPSRFDYRTFEARRPVLAIQLFTLMALTLMLILLYPQDSLKVLAFMTVYGAAVMALSAALRRRYFRKVYTSMPTRNGKLLVLRNKQHDGIVKELEARRIRCLRKFAMIDTLNAPRSELRRLRWLQEEGAITQAEFDSYRRALGPTVDAGPFPEPEEQGKPLIVAQDAFRFHSKFSFHDEYLEYAMNDGARTEFNVRYNDLPPPTDYRTFARKDGLAAVVLCLGMLVAMALVNTYSGDRYYATAEGFRQMAMGAAIFAPALAFLVLGARRYARKEFTIVPVAKGTIRVLQDAQHDRLIGEMQQRRHAALREQAVIDDHHSPQHELRKFTWLKEQGAITDQEFEAFRQKILNALAERPSSSAEPPKPPRETLH